MVNYIYGNPAAPVFVNTSLLYQQQDCGQDDPPPQLSGTGMEHGNYMPDNFYLHLIAFATVEVDSPFSITGNAELSLCDDSFHMHAEEPSGTFMIYDTGVSNLNFTFDMVHALFKYPFFKIIIYFFTGGSYLFRIHRGRYSNKQ